MSAFFDWVDSQRRALGLAVTAAALFGAWTASRMPASILPEVTFPRITVIAEAGEQPSDVMLRTVTRPLEEAVRSVPGVREVRSTTSRGSAEINLDCAWGSDMPLALQRVQAQLEAVRTQLPPGTTLDARLMSPALFPVLGFSLTADRVSQARLRDAAMLLIKPELARLPGVAEVVVQGGRRIEARVELDPAELQARGLDAASVADAVRSATTLTSVGLLESNLQLYLGLADGRPTDLAALDALPIPVAGGPPVPLGRLGRVRLDEAPEFTRYQANARPAVLVNVLRQPSASAVELSVAAHRWFEQNQRRLPPGTRVQTFYDQSDLVRASANSVRDSLLVGALLAIVVVMIFLRDLRLSLAGALVLPGSIAMTLVALHLTHQSLNMMTMGGIAAAVGLVLDDAIVVVEHLAARLAEPRGCSKSQAMAEIFPTLSGSSLCTLVMFVPFIALDGVTGAFFRVLSLAMALMLASSLLLCVTLVPALLGGSGAPRRHETRGRSRYATVLAWAVAHRTVAIAAVLVCIGLAVPLQWTLGTGFLPEMDEGALILDYGAPPGTAIAETDRMLRQLEGVLQGMPEIASWSRRTGDQLGFFITEPNRGDYVLRLRSGRRRPADRIADDLRTRVEAALPALSIEFGQLVEDVIGDLTTSPQPIEVRVFSEDRRVVESKAEELARLLSKVRGVVDVRSGVVVSGPNVTIVPAAGAAIAGLRASDLGRAADPAIGGIDGGEIVRGIRAWPVRIMLARPPGTSGAAVLSGVQVPTAAGVRVRLGDLAVLRTEPGETEIARDNLRTMVAVTARLSGRDLGSAVKEIRSRIRSGMVLPGDMTLQFGGLWAEQQASFRGLAAVLLGVASLVAFLLLLSFRSWGETGAVLMVVTASLAGVFAALHLGRSTFNISSFVGAIMTVGIVSENAYFLVAAYRAARAAGQRAEQAARAAALRRARPILMTTVAGISALAPLALGIGAGAHLLQPLAIAVIGGFGASAALLLFVLPPLLAATAGRNG